MTTILFTETLKLKVAGKCCYDHHQSFTISTICTIHTPYDIKKSKFINPKKWLKICLCVSVCARKLNRI